jgi:3-phenylpropionate/trans-cinnamate dioxygenase ferredoxin reductase subunit
MRMPGNIIIVGAGQAASQAIDTLRKNGFGGSITLIGDEPHWPYQRPPLSKKFLVGSLDRDRLLIRPASFYAAQGVQAHLGRRATAIDRALRRVSLDDGSSIPYDALLLCTGSRPRQLRIPGAAHAGLHVVRTLDDVDALRAEMSPGRRVVIVGGGYIGLETAATAKELGLEVLVIEMTDRVMNRVVAPVLSRFYEAEHVRRGVRVVCGVTVEEFVGDATGRVEFVRCSDGTEYPADLVVIGIGAVAADELAAASGIECASGIVVDEYCRTSDPHVYAAGDCARHPSIRYGRQQRLESVDNAFEQGSSAALNMLGITSIHDRVPWFWSDQYDLKLIIVGLSDGYDQAIVRGDVAARSFSVCYLKGGELVAVDTVNCARDQIAARKLVAARARPDPVRVGDPSIALKDACT